MHRTIVTFAVALVAAATSASAQFPVRFLAERDTMIPEAHKPNNDGGWGYGWIKVSQGAHNYGLLGFDVSGLDSLDPQAITSATLKLRVAQNHFAQAGKWYDVYAWDPSTTIVDWNEGTFRFDLFSYCSQSEWARPAAQNDPMAQGHDFGGGATWSCSNDEDVEDGSVACPEPVAAYEWDVPPELGVHLGFSIPGVVPIPVAEFFGKKQASTPEEEAEFCPNLHPDIARNCDPLCGKSIECFEDEEDETKGTADACYRTVEIDLTESLRQFVADGVGHPSWLIRRNTNTGAGAFHYFSREGAVCILGACGTNPKYQELMPVLDVELTQPPPGPVVEPALDCSQSHPGWCPPA